jgi:hypothetical protein
MNRKIMLGCDPELFLMDATGKLRASCGLIGGTKAHPMPLPLGKGYAVQEDNVAIEFNIPPAANAKEFQESIKKTLEFLQNGVRSMYDFSITNLSAASFPKDELVAPAALEFGCDPDYNAWTGKRNPRPKAEDETLRSCGGHVHVGLDTVGIDDKQIIKAMDLFLGVPSVLMDKGELRKKLYGKAGAYRTWVKGDWHGVEYRTLSNFWVAAQDDRLTKWVWDNTEKAVNAVDLRLVVDDYKDSILDAIDNNNKEAAGFLINRFNLEVLHV